MVKSEIILNIEGVDLLAFYGQYDDKLNLIRRAFPSISMTTRGTKLKISGDKKNTQAAKSKIEAMVKVLREHHELSKFTVLDILNGMNMGEVNEKSIKKEIIVHGKDGRPIRARTINQRRLVEAVEKNDIVFAVGPAGTGKTYIAVALAVRALKNKQVKKIILTRPAVEAGENLGFLPGDLKEKVDPFLIPLYDALHDMIPADKLKYFMENRTIEVAPLAFMRGRTLNNAFVILDEAQNTTTMQIKMFLTRLGPTAKYIITGDLTQVDLPYRQPSGLRKSMNLLKNIKGVEVIKLTSEDVVRHRLVKDIIDVYTKESERHQQNKNEEE